MMTSNKSVRRADFDYLRSYAVLLVLWHHATLAYSSVMVLIEENPLWQVKPRQASGGLGPLRRADRS
jgi:peptidoglycan/LPS O-acetylase OafA/YrhL